jgi:hypothetical protein
MLNSFGQSLRFGGINKGLLQKIGGQFSSNLQKIQGLSTDMAKPPGLSLWALCSLESASERVVEKFLTRCFSSVLFIQTFFVVLELQCSKSNATALNP